MRKPIIVLTAIFGAAFLAALAVAAAPLLAPPHDPAHWTAPAANVSQGSFVEREQPDLARFAASNTYTAPQVPGSETHSLRTGLLAQRWVSYAPGSAQGPRPLILLFPGSGRPAMSMIDMWQETAREEGLVLAAIDGLRSSNAAETPDAAFLLGVVAEVQRLHNIDPERIYLFGHSAGSILAQVVVNRVEGPWRAAAGHAGYVVPSWLHPVEGAAPVRHYLGSSDGIFSPANARIAGQSMTFAGHDHELVLIPGHTHWFYEIGPTISADAWAWFDGL